MSCVCKCFMSNNYKSEQEIHGDFLHSHHFTYGALLIYLHSLAKIIIFFPHLDNEEAKSMPV